MVADAEMLAGQHAVVTGAGSGIGAAIASRLAQQGARITLMGRNEAKLESTARTIATPDRTHCIAIDIVSRDSVVSSMAAARAKFGRVDILVNNAGQALSAPFQKTSETAWRQLLDVNLTGAFHCIQAVLPEMLAAGWGRIINVASTAGLRGYAYTAAYVASKHGLVGLTRALALEVARSGVTVNCVCPGFTDTEIVREAIANIVGKTGRTEAEASEALLAVNPQRRFVQPEEIAHTVLWLCSRGSASITGQSIAIAGGEVT